MNQKTLGRIVMGGLVVVVLSGCSKPQESQQDLINAQKASAAADARVRLRPESSGPVTRSTSPQGASPQGTSPGGTEERVRR